MKYFFLETDEGNKIPYAINKNRAIDIRYLTKEGLSRLPMWTIVRMVFPEEGFSRIFFVSPACFFQRPA